MTTPNELSREFRTDESADMRRRRAGVALSLAATAIAGAMGAYQMGLLGRPRRTADKVSPAKVLGSELGYAAFQMPDAFQTMVIFGLTTALTSAGGANRARAYPALPIIACGKAGFDFLSGIVISIAEWRATKALSGGTQVLTAISAATFALALPEALEAAK